jgi:hypothetical protein
MKQRMIWESNHNEGRFWESIKRDPLGHDVAPESNDPCALTASTACRQQRHFPLEVLARKPAWSVRTTSQDHLR